MPSEDRVTIAMTEEARRDAAGVLFRAEKAGKGVRFAKSGLPNMTAIIHYALALVGGRAAMDLDLPPLLSPRGPHATPGKRRLKRAMAARGLSTRALAEQRRVKCHHTTIGHVLAGKVPLETAAGGKLLAWVESVEAAG